MSKHVRSSYTIKNPHRDPNISNEKWIEQFVVLENLSIVTSSLWHSRKKYIHEKLFVGTQQECQEFVFKEARRLLGE